MNREKKLDEIRRFAESATLEEINALISLASSLRSGPPAKSNNQALPRSPSQPIQ